MHRGVENRNENNVKRSQEETMATRRVRRDAEVVEDENLQQGRLKNVYSYSYSAGDMTVYLIIFFYDIRALTLITNKLCW